MFAAHRIVLPLKLLLVLAAAYSLVLLVFSVPGSFLHDLARDGTSAPLIIPVFIVVELGILGFLVIAVCTWRLLTLVREDRIFTPDSMRWVGAIVWTFVAGWVATVALAVYLSAVVLLTPALRDPGVPVALLGVVLLGAVLVMVVAVLRTLLRRATAMQTDLDGVL